MKLKYLFLATIATLALASCSEDRKDEPDNPDKPGTGVIDTPETEGEIGVSIDSSITPWDGTTATDKASDKVSNTDADTYWEANSWRNKVTVTYNGNDATVESNHASIRIHKDGAHVTLDFLTPGLSEVEVALKGSSSDGSLKVYGSKKFKLSLEGVDLTSNRGPAINNQDGKRVYVDLKSGTRNKLTDCATYTDDHYYLAGATSLTEDRKGAFFSEGDMIISGDGVLEVTGKYRHGIAVDGTYYQRPGVTVVINDAAKSALRIKGDDTDLTGVTIKGGYLYARTSGNAGKAIKTEQNVDISGATLVLNTSGDATYDDEELDTSSAACIKAGTSVTISSANVTCHSTGKGGKGINAGGNINISGATLTVTATGQNYVDSSSSADSSSKGIKSLTDVTLSNDATVKVYAYDDAVAAQTVTFNGGQAWIYSIDKNGVDAKGTITINSGTVIASGDEGTGDGLDVSDVDSLIIKGGTVVATGGQQTTPAAASTQGWVVTDWFAALRGRTIALVPTTGGNPVMIYLEPRTMEKMQLLFSSPKLSRGTTCNLISGATASSTSYTNGLSLTGTLADGKTLGIVTAM